MSLRTTCPAVADRQQRCRWGFSIFGKAVADFRQGRCGFCRGGAALLAALPMCVRNLCVKGTCYFVNPIEKHACSTGTCYFVLRSAAQRRTLNTSAALPMVLSLPLGGCSYGNVHFEEKIASWQGPQAHFPKSAAGRLYLRASAALPMVVRSAAGRRTLTQNNESPQIKNFLGQGWSYEI